MYLFLCTGVEHMIANGSYAAAYPLHEGPYKSEHSLLTHGPLNDRHVSIRTGGGGLLMI